ncbi:MAG TPA: EAL domain-containing protein [Thiobacillaceae bacterium]|nr:EAL domain-containing protein [Thiobacillaceae bacterium]HNU62944.1 EAL domain-containing protein [Thiobacillaceae bacterium]
MFLSIRWQIIILAGLVMAGMAALYSLQQQYDLSRQFSLDQAAYRERLRVTASRLLHAQNDRLQVLARMLVETPAIRSALRAGDGERLREAVEPLWSELSLSQGLSTLVFFDADQRVLGQWGAGAPAPLVALAERAERNEMPQVWVSCGARCEHQVVLPTTQHGRPLGTVALVSGLEDVVLDLRRLGEGEVAVLAAGGNGAHDRLKNMRLLSVSGGESAHRILRAAQAKAWSENYIPVVVNGDTWHVMTFAPDFPGDGLLRLAVAADVTRGVRNIELATWRNLAWGGGVLLLALVVMYFLLRPAMQRIRRVSGLLPLLGQEKFMEVAAAIPQNPEHWLEDEMRVLERLAFDLAYQLQSLHDADKAHAAALSAQATQLEQERDLVAGLLDTAPVLIITYGGDGRIRMANAFAVADSGFRRDQLVGQSFQRMFMHATEIDEYRLRLEAMHPGDVVHGEGSFRHGVLDEPRDVVWFHSCLDDVQGERLYLSVGLDVTEHRLAERRLQTLVEQDVVTGLLNRHTFKRRLDGLLSRAGKGVVIVSDIDEFRSINDLDGHEAGDQLLVAFARHIQNLYPAPLYAARLGSDEFALVYPDLSSADAILIGRLLSRVAAQRISDHEGTLRRSLSACVGLVVYPEHGESADALLGNAELALANARAKGHGSWHLYSDQESYREQADRRAYWLEEVENALDEGRFVLHFQPIVQVDTGKISHHEALLRLVGQDGKLIPPGYFIDVAESTGLIRRIDRWVMQAGVRAVARHHGARIALNLSSRSFEDDLTFETLQSSLAQEQVAGESLLLEITETAALANFSAAKRIMAKFKELGCAFGLDDFGVGYSSFQYLRELPVDFVKIDGSFIKNLTKNADDVVFVRALNSAVQGFGKATVAEFVEDEETLDILREIGVDQAQGYLLGRPGPEIRAGD